MSAAIAWVVGIALGFVCGCGWGFCHAQLPSGQRLARAIEYWAGVRNRI